MMNLNVDNLIQSGDGSVQNPEDIVLHELEKLQQDLNKVFSNIQSRLDKLTELMIKARSECSQAREMN
jgi:hypothetical protein